MFHTRKHDGDIPALQRIGNGIRMIPQRKETVNYATRERVDQSSRSNIFVLSLIVPFDTLASAKAQ